MVKRKKKKKEIGRRVIQHEKIRMMYQSSVVYQRFNPDKLPFRVVLG